MGLVGSATIMAQEIASPVFIPGPAAAAVGFKVAVSCATSGAEIHYTTNGEDPTIHDPSLGDGGVVEIKRNLTLKAKAWVDGQTSAVTMADYSVTGDLSAGAQHMLALKSPGAIYAWGLQSNGRLGNGATATGEVLSPTPSLSNPATPIQDAAMVAAGVTHSVWLDHTGGVWSFGQNTYGALGNNSTDPAAYAVRVLQSATAGDFLKSCREVSAGEYFSAALGESGEVYTWGLRTNGRLGDGNPNGTRLFAGKVKSDDPGNPVLTGIAGMDLGDAHGVAREPNAWEKAGCLGQVWVWGENGSGQLGTGGYGSTAMKPYATRMKLNATTYLTDAWDVSAADNHTAILRWKAGDTDLQGTVWTVGARANGRLGDGKSKSMSGTQTYPVRVVQLDGSPLKDIVQVSAGSSHTLALDKFGNVWAWGENTSGALGDSLYDDKNYAVQVHGPNNVGFLTNIVRVSAGGSTTANFSAAISRDGTIYTWGRNANGQLGIGTKSTAANPLPKVVATLRSLPNYPDVSLTPSVIDDMEPGFVSLIATPSDTDGSANILKVDFFNQGQWMGAATTAPWSVTLPDLTANTYHSYAIVTDRDGNTGMSLPARFSIRENPDRDGDGLLDAWELQWFGHCNARPEDDSDGDKISNVYERNQGTNPMSPLDSDGDGMADDWEQFWFGGLAQDGGSDADGDLVANAQEFAMDSNPLSANDGDGDALPDDWERHTLGSTSQDADGDPDQDRVSNAYEFILALNPMSATDGDGDDLSDDWEILWFGNLEKTGEDHGDDDKVSNLHEFMLKTNPLSAADDDGDGLPDDWERYWFDEVGHDGTGDPDGDLLSNAMEFTMGTNPIFGEDSDQDGLADEWEQHWFGNLNQNVDQDNDGDGELNGMEFGACSSPTNANSTSKTADKDGDSISNEEDADPDDRAICWKKTAESSFAVIEIENWPAEAQPIDLGEGGHILAVKYSGSWSSSPSMADASNHVWSPATGAWSSPLSQKIYCIGHATQIDPLGNVLGRAIQSLETNDDPPQPATFPGAEFVSGIWRIKSDGTYEDFDKDWKACHASWLKFGEQPFSSEQGGSAALPPTEQNALPVAGNGGDYLTLTYAVDLSRPNFVFKLMLGSQAVHEINQGNPWFIEQAAGCRQGWYGFVTSTTEMNPLVCKIVLPSGSCKNGPTSSTPGNPTIDHLSMIDSDLLPAVEAPAVQPRVVVWSSGARVAVGKLKSDADDIDWKLSAVGRAGGKMNSRGVGLLGDRIWRNGRSIQFSELVDSTVWTNVIGTDINDKGMILAKADKKDANGIVTTRDVNVLLVPFAIEAYKRGTINTPGAKVPPGTGEYGYETVMMENADSEDNTQGQRDCDSNGNAHPSKDDDLVKVVLKFPQGMKIPGSLELLHENMQVDATKKTATEAVKTSGPSRINFYRMDGSRITDLAKELKIPDLKSPPANCYLAKLVTDGEVTLFLEGANEFGNLSNKNMDKLGGSQIRFKYEGISASENKLLIYRGGFLAFRLPRTSSPLPVDGVLGELQFWDGKGRVRHEFGGKGKEFKVDVTDWGKQIEHWPARSGRAKGSDYDVCDEGGHVPPGWFSQKICKLKWVNESDDKHQINRNEIDGEKNPPLPFLDQGSYCRWKQDDEQVEENRYTENFRYYPSLAHDANIGSPESLTIKFKYDVDAIYPTDMQSRYAIQIHPDGKKNGTAGCIGIQSYSDCQKINRKLNEFHGLKLKVQFYDKK